MISDALQKAIDCLSIQDIYLRDLVVRCADDFEPKYHAVESLKFETKHFVKRSTVVEIDESQQFLRVFIDLGARWVASDGLGEDAVKALIEAQFVAEYAMLEPLAQISIDEFSLQNVSYHVWPYWRELLNSNCTRMSMPRVVLPAVQLAQNRRES